MASRVSHSESETGEVSDINVTPFIDVILVLLIIFMVAAPLSTVDIAVDLPAAAASPQPRPPKPAYLTIRADRMISVGNADLPQDRIISAIDELTAGDKETRIYLRVDKAVDYGSIMGVLNVLRTAGYLKIALVGLEQAQ